MIRLIEFSNYIYYKVVNLHNVNTNVEADCFVFLHIFLYELELIGNSSI